METAEEAIVIEILDVLDLTGSHFSDKDLEEIPMPSTLTVSLSCFTTPNPLKTCQVL